ncbi:hypothetical protein RHMOL_Rhmol12G0166400 [Rhododendron molle]|uniref:Uncharacterized protein n=1 Tax=Rhododendron molle TaxID=49168 RepID=A0ACC0LJ86_RHOML|nr:hypothetical protein RHMOL_Rhmol12G0166400 [Rhododendron molle]
MQRSASTRTDGLPLGAIRIFVGSEMSGLVGCQDSRCPVRLGPGVGKVEPGFDLAHREIMEDLLMQWFKRTRGRRLVVKDRENLLGIVIRGQILRKENSFNAR